MATASVISRPPRSRAPMRLDPSAMTARQFYDGAFAAFFHGTASPGTRMQYRITLTHWEKYTDNLPLTEIDHEQVAMFITGLSEDRSPATVAKNLRQFNHMMAKAGPPERHNRNALNLIECPPWAQAPRHTKRRRLRTLSDEQLRELYDACEIATLPEVEGIDPVAYWRAFVVVKRNVVWRKGVMLGTQWEHVDLVRREWYCPATLDKAKQDRLKPFNNTTLEHLLPIRRASGHVFPWPHCNGRFYKQFKAICDAALVSCKPHELKATGLSALARLGLSDWATRYMGDHAQADITGRHYIDPTEEVRKIIDKVSQPWKYKRGEETRRTRRRG